jgi:hypothetical protein
MITIFGAISYFQQIHYELPKEAQLAKKLPSLITLDLSMAVDSNQLDEETIDVEFRFIFIRY